MSGGSGPEKPPGTKAKDAGCETGKGKASKKSHTEILLYAKRNKLYTFKDLNYRIK